MTFDGLKNEATQLPRQRTAAVVGAGPGGLTVATRLALAGWKTILFEARADPDLVPIEDARGIVLTLSSFAFHNLPPGLVPAIEARGQRLVGRVIYAGDDIYLEPYGSLADDWFLAISRADLLRLLAADARRAGVDIHYQHKVFNPRPARGELEVRINHVPRLHNRRYDLVVFADGVNGNSRAVMGPDASYRKEVDKQYVAVTIEDASARLFPNRISFWPGRGNTVIAIPDAGNGVNALVVGEFAGSAEKPPFPTVAAAERFLRSRNPQVLRALPELSGLLARRPRGFFHVTDTTRWTRGRAVMVGDAARCLPPYGGIGAAAAMDDARVLVDSLTAEATVEEALRRYEANRTIASALLRRMVLEHGELLTAEIGSFVWQVRSAFKHVAEQYFGVRDLYQRIVFEAGGLERLIRAAENRTTETHAAIAS